MTREAASPFLKHGKHKSHWTVYATLKLCESPISRLGCVPICRHIQPMSDSSRYTTLGLIVPAVVLLTSVSLMSAFGVFTVDDVAAAAHPISGTARVVDGDTLQVAGKRIRLEGIDAPERAQTCPRKWVGTWSCGKAATRWLERFIAGRHVRCRQVGRDKYGRVIGICYAGKDEINSVMVREGLAWAFVKYSERYIGEEAAARRDRKGIWTGAGRKRFAQKAWAYREQRWTFAAQKAPEGCAIKGNISGKGRIYHPPWSPWYSRVKISKARGERWFCSEREAIAAGWRPVVVR